MITNEIPHKFSKELAQAVKEYTQRMLGDKQDVHGCDYQDVHGCDYHLHLVHLCLIVEEKCVAAKDKKIYHLLRLLEELCHLCYMSEEKRSPKSILRMLLSLVLYV